MHDACERLADVLANRGRHPRSVGYLLQFGELSEREAAIVTSLMTRCAIELRVACRDDEASAEQLRESLMERAGLVRNVNRNGAARREKAHGE